MRDEITGVVVLQKTTEPLVWRLCFQYTKQDGFISYSSIPVKRKSDPKPADHPGPVWNFVERSPFLDCSPSVRILGPKEGEPDHFHNGGAWTNYYVVMADRPDGEGPGCYSVCREINQFKTKPERDGIIFRLRAEGVLL